MSCQALVTTLEELVSQVVSSPSEAPEVNDIGSKLPVTDLCLQIIDTVAKLTPHRIPDNDGDFEGVVDRIDDAGVRLWNDTVRNRSHRAGGGCLDPLPHKREAAFYILRLAAPAKEDVRVIIKFSQLALKMGKGWLGEPVIEDFLILEEPLESMNR
ncbi:hypothetical protein HKX48_006531 [Thoreauomyces humboldtii]|nr:hypothetical protein HKX48_006531 [Thoreauomyces humboldtii]